MRTAIAILILMVTTSVAMAGETKCPACRAAGLKSTTTVGCTMTTLMATHSYYDEDGNYHFDDPNISTTSYSCSRGHSWSEADGVVVAGEAERIDIIKVCPGATNELILYGTNAVLTCTDTEAFLTITNDWYYEPTDITITQDGWKIYTDHGEYIVTNGLIRAVKEDAAFEKGGE